MRFPLRFALGATALAAILSASCVESSPAGPIMPLVPQGAIAAVVVESPFKLYEAAAEFWKAAGLDKTTGADLQALLEKTFSPSSEIRQTLDFARPWVLAVLPSGGPAAGGKRTRILLYVPYRSSPEALLEKFLGEGSFAPVAKAKGYIVFSDEGDEIPFPPAKSADLSRLTRFPASSIKLWADPAALRRATADGFKPIAEAARRFVTDPARPGKADSETIVRALGELGSSLLSQLGLSEASIEPGPAGLTLRAGASSAPGSDLRRALAAASRAPSALDWASQVGSGSLFGAVWSDDGLASSDFCRRLTEGLYLALGFPPDAAAKVSAFQAKWSRAAGPRGAMSLDLDIDENAMSGIEDPKSDDPAAASALLAKALRFKFELLREVRDQAAYRALLRGFASDPDFLAFSKAYAEVFGLSFSATSRDLKEGAFPYGELALSFDVLDGGKLGSLEGGKTKAQAIETALGAFAPQLSTRWSISQGRFVATNGDVAALKALAARKGVKKSLASDSAFAAFAKALPPKPVFVGVLSMRKLMALAEAAAKAAAKADARDSEPASTPEPSSLPDPSLFGSWYSYLAVDSRGGAPGLEAGLFIPAPDLGAFVRMGAGPLKQKNTLNGGA